MTENRKEIIITIILIFIFTGLIYLNFISFEIFEKRVLARIERHSILEAQQQEKQDARQSTADYIRSREIARNQDIKDIVDFDKKYSEFKKDYLENLDIIAEGLEEKVVNIDDIIALAAKRIAAARKFRESLENIEHVPEPLEDLHNLLLLFLENDIATWEATRSYYSGEYNGSIADMKKLHNDNTLLYQQTQELQKEVYSLYGLEDLL
jgi:hypothetical protein